MPDFQNIIKNVPRYLFRVQSSNSQGRFSSGGGFRASRDLYTHEESHAEAKALLSAHLLWHKTPTYWISTTSSLLWALVYARWRVGSADKDVSISLIASARIDKTTVFLAMDLVKYYGLEKVGKIWHDKPEGEHLIKWRIPPDALRGTVGFPDISTEFERLVPELVDSADHRSSQVTAELRRVCFPDIKSPRLNRDAGRTDTGVWPFSVEDYVSARHIAQSFGDEEAQGLLTLMCLSFRRRDLDSLGMIIANLRQVIKFGKISFSCASGLTLLARMVR